MLVLSRKLKQEILIGDNVKITVLKVKGNTVRLGIDAPREVHVVRGELEPKVERTIIEVPIAEVPDVEMPVSESENKDDDQYGQFTVVFRNNENESTKVDVIPFESGGRTEQSKTSGGTQQRSTKVVPPTTELENVDTDKVESIEFRNRIPKALYHNRLKEIVDSLTTNKK